MSILNLSFNHNASLLTCCTNYGYLVYKLQPAIQKHIVGNKKGGVGIMKLFNRTNLFILTGGGISPFVSKNIIILWDDADKIIKLQVDLKEPIKNAFILEDKLVIVLENRLCIFGHTGYLINSKDTYYNEDGLCTITNNSKNPIIACLGLKKGEIAVWKPQHDIYYTFQAHSNHITALATSHDGTLIATASESATNIHVYDTKQKKQVYKLRRGTDLVYGTSIHSLCFSKDNKFLACCSSNGTVHIFHLGEEDNTMNTKSYLSYFSSYLPEYANSEWSYKKVYINCTSKMRCAFDDQDVLHIATWEGDYFKIYGKNYEKVKRNKLHTNSTQFPHK